jgi:hypothetical protein
MRRAKIIVVGGGLAGIGCATEFEKLGIEDFLLISKDIGGRAPRTDETIPRATFYVRTEYKNLKLFLKLGRRADAWKGRLVTPTKTWRPLFIMLRHPFLAVRFYALTRKFNNHYTRFMALCETASQKEAMEDDPYLKNLYQMKATDFLKTHGLTKLQPELIATLVRVTGFITIEEASAFLMFWIWLILVKNGRECTIDIQEMTKGIASKIVVDEIREIKNTPQGWLLNDAFLCDTLVMATPINITKKMLGDSSLPDQKIIEVYSCIVEGRPRPLYNQGQYNVLPADEKDVVVVKNDDGTYLFCSTSETYDLGKYFESFKVIEKKNWNPAGFFGDALIDSKRSKDLYVIGDYHFPGLEPAYLTGIQAARSIKADISI